MSQVGNIWVKLGLKDNASKQMQAAFGQMRSMAFRFASIMGGMSFFKNGLQELSNYAEAQGNLNRVIGKEGTAALEQFAAGAAAAAGLSKGQVLDSANQLAGIFQRIPAGTIDASKAIQDLIQRSADLGQAWGRSSEEIRSGMQSALIGRVPLMLKEMNVDLADNAINAQIAAGAFTQYGIASNMAFNQLSSAQQVLVRYLMIMQQTSSVTGEFAKNLGTSLSGQIGKTKADFSNLTSTITQTMLPAIMNILKVVQNLITWFDKAKVYIMAFAGAFLAVKVSSFIIKVGQAVRALIALAVAKEAASKGIGALITAPILIAGLSAIIGGIGGGIMASMNSGGGGGGEASTAAPANVIHVTVNTADSSLQVSGNGRNNNVQAAFGRMGS